MDISVKTRRTAFVTLLVVALLAFAVALYVTLTAQSNAFLWLVGAVIVLVLALAGELFLLVFRESSKFDEKGEDWYDWEKEARGGEEILLRCSNCRETFTLRDTGERPLRHTCPHCGRTGVLKDPASTKPAPQRGGV